jgi:hypothetical protein
VASIGLGLACLGCLLLSLSLRRHYRQVFADLDAYPRRLWPLRIAGYACALLALWPCVLLCGPWVGLVLWVSMVALAAFVQIMLLTYRPQVSALFGGFSVALIALGLLL